VTAEEAWISRRTTGWASADYTGHPSPSYRTIATATFDEVFSNNGTMVVKMPSRSAARVRGFAQKPTGRTAPLNKPLLPPSDGFTDSDHFRERGRDRAGGVIQCWLLAQGFGTQQYFFERK
jgi:hypothetical protein